MTAYSATQTSPLIRKTADVLALILHPYVLLFCFNLKMIALAQGVPRQVVIEMLLVSFLTTLALPVSIAFFNGKDFGLQKKSTRLLGLESILAGYALLFLLGRADTQYPFYNHTSACLSMTAVNLAAMLLLSLRFHLSLHANAFGMFSLLGAVLLSAFERVAVASVGIIALAGILFLVLRLLHASGIYSWRQIGWSFFLGFIFALLGAGFP